jgi:ParB-like chromosome segregation protein Spo0J
MTTPTTTTTTPNAAPQSKEYEFHPIVDIFPLMTGDEFNRFKEDIKTRKQQEPIITYEGKILDGRNRYNACKELRLTPEIKPYEGYDPLGFVLSANLHRRHLKESQRAVIAAKLVTTKLGDNQHIRKEGRPIDQPTAAKMLNVSPKSVQRAKEVRDNASPEVLGFVETGKVPVSVAAKVVSKLPNKEDQTALAIKGASEINKKVKEWKQAEEQAATQGGTPKGSDKIDGLVDTLIAKLKEMKAANADNAEAAVANLIQRLHDADLWTELKKKAA